MGDDIRPLLDIAPRWIRETMEDFKSLEEDISLSTAQSAPEAVHSNWRSLVSFLDRIGKHLLDHIEEQTDKTEQQFRYSINVIGQG
jgi:hypothetical protein